MRMHPLFHLHNQAADCQKGRDHEKPSANCMHCSRLCSNF